MLLLCLEVFKNSSSQITVARPTCTNSFTSEKTRGAWSASNTSDRQAVSMTTAQQLGFWSCLTGEGGKLCSFATPVPARNNLSFHGRVLSFRSFPNCARFWNWWYYQYIRPNLGFTLNSHLSKFWVLAQQNARTLWVQHVQTSCAEVCCEKMWETDFDFPKSFQALWESPQANKNRCTSRESLPCGKWPFPPCYLWLKTENLKHLPMSWCHAAAWGSVATSCKQFSSNAHWFCRINIFISGICTNRSNIFPLWTVDCTFKILSVVAPGAHISPTWYNMVCHRSSIIFAQHTKLGVAKLLKMCGNICDFTSGNIKLKKTIRIAC